MQKVHYQSACVVQRDGPLEKLWGGGGRGIFQPQEFFFVIKFLFRLKHEYFLGLIGVHEFFFM